MRREGLDQSDIKSQLILQICSISTTHVACVHTIHSHFIDWYRILGVEEDAEIDIIRKKYRSLALLLHPDKNKYVNAEVAFKLVSEAYTCLSDNARRNAFNLERYEKFCIACGRIPFGAQNSPTHTSRTPKLRKHSSAKSRTCHVSQGLEEMRNRLREEARVIDNCLKTNGMSMKQSFVFNPSDDAGKSLKYKSKKESPVFNPCDYMFHGYPHVRSHVFIKSDLFRCMERRNMNERPGSRLFESKSAW